MTGHQLLSGIHTHRERTGQGRRGTGVVSDYYEAHPTQTLSPSHQDSQGTILSVFPTPHPINTAVQSLKLQQNLLQNQLWCTHFQKYCLFTSNLFLLLSFFCSGCFFFLKFKWNQLFLNLQSISGVPTPAQRTCCLRKIFRAMQYYTGHQYYVISSEIMESLLRYHLSHVL